MLNEQAGRLGPRRRAELPHGAADMLVDSGLLQPEIFGDVLRLLELGDAQQTVAFARGQLVEAVHGSVGAVMSSRWSRHSVSM